MAHPMLTYCIKSLAQQLSVKQAFYLHSEEEALLTDNEYQWDMAWAIFTGLVEYLNEGSQQETA